MTTKEESINFLDWVNKNYHFLSDDEYEPEEYPIGYEGDRLTYTSGELYDIWLNQFKP